MSSHLQRHLSRWLLAAIFVSVVASAQAADAGLLSRSELAKASGEQIYQHICQGCHMADGRGATGAGTYPALAGNPNLASAQFIATVVLHGRKDMPSFVLRPDLRGFEAMTHCGLDDAQIAGVVNYVRSHFGNDYKDSLSASDVSALHPAQKDTP